jgi:hypothetical protein
LEPHRLGLWETADPRRRTFKLGSRGAGGVEVDCAEDHRGSGDVQRSPNVVPGGG